MKYLIAIVALTGTICFSQGYYYHYNYGLPMQTPSISQFTGEEKCILYCNEYSGVCTRYLERYAKDKMMPYQEVKSSISSDSNRRYDDYYNIEDQYDYGGGAYNLQIYPWHQSNGYFSPIYSSNLIGGSKTPQYIPKIVTTSAGGGLYRTLVRN